MKQTNQTASDIKGAQDAGAASPNNALTNAKTTAVAVSAPEQTKAIPGLVPSDMIVPKVLCMQGLSELVAARKAQLGDIVRSTNAEKLGDPEHPIQFIPLSFPKTDWIIELMTAGKFKYKKSMARDAKNSGLEWNFWSDKDGNEVPFGTVGAVEARRVQRLSLFALLPQDIDAEAAEKKKMENGEFPDISKALMPVMISFRSFSFNAGKEVVSFFTQANSFKTQAYKYLLGLGCKMQQNDKGTFYVFQVDRARPQAVPAVYAQVVEYWANIVFAQDLVVDESADEGDVGIGGGGQTQF